MSFELFLFTDDPSTIAEAEAAGVDGFVVDWERKGKLERQAGADTQVNADTPETLERVRAAADGRVVCRINAHGSHTPGEVEAAVELGADELLLPMVTDPAQVREVIDLAAGRCGVGILVETEAAVSSVEELAGLPIARAYAGLNDLAIDRGAGSIFEAVADGTVERIASAMTVPFGFAGLTRPALGRPIPCRLLIAEMARLGASFSFLRRSYLRDVGAGQHAAAIDEIRNALAAAAQRDGAEVAADRADLAESIDAVAGG